MVSFRIIMKTMKFNQRFIVDGRRLQIAVTGLDYPKDSGSWILLTAGRHLHSGHYEAIAYLKPHFQLESLSASMRLVAEVPQKS